MAIDYNSGISSLQTGAPDIKYTGDQGPRSPDQQLMASADPMLVDMYQQYVFEMEEQGMQPMSFRQFMEQAMSGMAYGGTAKPTYTQSRKQRINAAGGGIMGSNAGSMLVAPTADGSRPGYGWISKIKDKFVDDIIPNEIKENPMLSAAVLGAGVNQFGLIPGMGGGVGDFGKNWIGDLLGGRDAVIGGIRPEGQKPLIDFSGIFSGNQSNVDKAKNILTGGGINPADPSTWEKANQLLNDPTGALKSAALQQFQKLTQQQNPGASLLDKFTNFMGPNEQGVNWKTPLAIGAAAGAAQAAMPKSILPQDTSGIDIANIRSRALTGSDPNLHFLPQASATTAYAKGGRIGYADSGLAGEYGVEGLGIWDKIAPSFLGGEKSNVVDAWKQTESALGRIEEINSELERITGMGDAAEGAYGQEGLAEKLSALENEKQQLEGTIELWNTIQQKAQGGRIGAQEGGLMNLGGMEKDYRQEGGFVPIGGEERADDVPARLSKNEFVFTADAVRAAGGGDIDAGAEVMENLMNNLERGGQVSEDSQGLEGARDMFATAQRLEGVM